MGHEFSARECGEGPRPRSLPCLKKRLECLERIRLQSPPLPYALEVAWERRKLAYCKRCPYKYGETTGSQFINKVNLVIATLGKHYAGHLRLDRSEHEIKKPKKY